MELTTEQQFKLKTFEIEAQKMSKEQLQQHLIEVIRQGMIKNNLFVQWAKQDFSQGI